jgi:RNA recognition motif-containing protein
MDEKGKEEREREKKKKSRSGGLFHFMVRKNDVERETERVRNAEFEKLVWLYDTDNSVFLFVSFFSSLLSAMALFIGRIPPSIKQYDLEDIFIKYGKITRCEIKVRSFGWVCWNRQTDLFFSHSSYCLFVCLSTERKKLL